MFRRGRTTPLLAMVGLMALFVAHIAAAGTDLWTIAGASQLEEGTSTSLAISSLGELSLAPAIEEIAESSAQGATSQPYLWCLAADEAGNVYVGTGNDGEVLRLSAAGELSVVVNTPEVAVLSLAIGPDGDLYAGTSPDGLIYRIDLDAVSPTPETIFDEDQRYVWDLLFDGDVLYAATGSDGKLFRLTHSAEAPSSYAAEVVLDAQQAHLMSLVAHEGLLYAGSDASGFVYRIDPGADGSAFVVHDTDETEVGNLAVSPSGGLFATTVTGQLPRPQAGGLINPPSGDQQHMQSYLYHISATGVLKRLWSSDNGIILSMAPFGDRVLVCTAGEGEIVAVSMDGSSTSLGKVSAGQVLDILPRAEGWTLATGNPGRLYSLAADVSDEGNWVSEAFDATVVSQWGTARWEASVPATCSVEAATRSGNTGTPDETWSEWSAALTDGAGSKITSPAARFLQVRMTLGTTDASQSPVVRLAEVAYLQANVAPDVSDLTVEEDGEPNGRPPSPGSGKPKIGNRTAKWTGQDVNEDELEYALYYRAEGGDTWHLLEEELTAPNHTWDDTPMPDGNYRVKVVATDARSNPTHRALTTERIGEPFRVDNTQPTITSPTASRVDEKRVQLVFSAEDTTSYLAEAAYALNADEWRVMFPTDDLFDSRSEGFDVVIPDVPAGHHSVAIRVVDRAGNSATARAEFE